jgi:hypothetical protein
MDRDHKPTKTRRELLAAMSQAEVRSDQGLRGPTDQPYIVDVATRLAKDIDAGVPVPPAMQPYVKEIVNLYKETQTGMDTETKAQVDYGDGKGPHTPKVKKGWYGT